MVHKRSKSSRKSNFQRAVTLDKATKDIGGRFAGRKNGKTLVSAGKTAGSAGVLFTSKELIRAKKRAISSAKRSLR